MLNEIVMRASIFSFHHVVDHLFIFTDCQLRLLSGNRRNWGLPVSRYSSIVLNKIYYHRSNFHCYAFDYTFERNLMGTGSEAQSPQTDFGPKKHLSWLRALRTRYVTKLIITISSLSSSPAEMKPGFSRLQLLLQRSHNVYQQHQK